MIASTNRGIRFAMMPTEIPNKIELPRHAPAMQADNSPIPIMIKNNCRIENLGSMLVFQTLTSVQDVEVRRLDHNIAIKSKIDLDFLKRSINIPN